MARFCIECGAILKDGASFCTKCGTPVFKSEPAVSEPAAPVEDTPAAEPVASVAFAADDPAPAAAEATTMLNAPEPVAGPVADPVAPAAEPGVTTVEDFAAKAASDPVSEPDADVAAAAAFGSASESAAESELDPFTTVVSEPVADPVFQEAPNSQPAYVTQPLSTPAPVGFCTTCGSPLSAGLAFCTNCGARVGAPAAAAPSSTASIPAPVPTEAPKKKSKVLPTILAILFFVAIGTGAAVLLFNPTILSSSSETEKVERKEGSSATDASDKKNSKKSSEDSDSDDESKKSEDSGDEEKSGEEKSDDSSSDSSDAGTIGSTSDDYVLPNSSTHLYTQQELSGLSDWDLMVARNEIFARYGRGFKDEQLQAYFNSKSWYTRKYSPDEFDSMSSPLNSTEKANAETIKAVEASR